MTEESFTCSTEQPVAPTKPLDALLWVIFTVAVFCSPIVIWAVWRSLL